MTAQQAPLELWGGIECTVARIGDGWRNQIEETGHLRRPVDIDLAVGLGIRTLRYPILWETVAPERPDRCDWRWTDERLAMLEERGIRVIAGLLHHGSGPRYTDLLDPDFPRKLADFAARAADRYPWIEDWTPVNEPLTTARFSALYGHWYPHRRDYPSFLRALANQCLGTLEAMKAIRARIPAARLVQTEDLGKTFSTAPLAYQARHENERRWLSLDLLCGRIGARHPWRDRLLGAGIGAEQLEALESGDATPDLLGINHYLTSERFLDHRLHLYPGHRPGGNGRDRYVDAEAVRVKRLAAGTGIAPRLREAWARYRIPIAVTEVHHGCHRDEQLRWFVEVWREAGKLRAEGMDLRAVTLWSLFGAVDWRFLLTERRGVYESGAFDTGGPAPRPTVIAKAASAFARGAPFDHPALDAPGWWRRPRRLYSWNPPCAPLACGGRKLLVTGASGTLGRAFARICTGRALPVSLTSRAELDICDEGAIAAALQRHRPWAVINTAGFVRTGDADREREACFAWNAEGAEKLARACAAAGIPLVTFSSDLVFDGAGGPYAEEDAPAPLCVYGASKAAAEARVLAAHPAALAIRTAAFFGPWDEQNYAWHVLAALRRGEGWRACPRTFVSPTYVPDLCHAALDLLIDGESGIWHLANKGAISWHGFAAAVAGRAGYDPKLILAEPAPVPRNTALTSGRGRLLRPFEDALGEWLAGRSAHPDLIPLAAE